MKRLRGMPSADIELKKPSTPHRNFRRWFIVSFCGGLITLILMAMTALFLVFSQGPIAIDSVRTEIERTLNAVLDENIEAKIGVANLTIQGGHIVVALTPVRIIDSKGDELLHIRQINTQLNLFSLLKGQVKPQDILIFDPFLDVRLLDVIDWTKLNFSENVEEGSVLFDDNLNFGKVEHIDFQDDQEPPLSQNKDKGPNKDKDIESNETSTQDAWRSSTSAPLLDLDDLMTNITDQLLQSQFHGVIIENGVLRQYDGRIIDSIQASMIVNTKQSGFQVDISAIGIAGSWSAHLKRSINKTGHKHTFLTFKDITAADLNPKLAMETKFFRAELPFFGTFEMTTSDEDELLDAKFDVEIGAGYLRFGRVEGTILDEAGFKGRWVSSEGAFHIYDARFFFGKTRANFTGMGVLRSLNDRSVIDLALMSDQVVLAPHDANEAPLGPGQIATHVQFDLDAMTLDIKTLDFKFAKGGFTAAGKMEFGIGETPSIALALTTHPMTVGVLKQFWPIFIAPLTRRWVVKNAISGYIDRSKLTVALPAGALVRDAKGALQIPDDGLDGDIHFRDLALYSFGKLPYLESLDGQLKLSGSSLDLRAKDGHVRDNDGKRVKITQGRFEIIDFAKRNPDTRLNLNLEGTTASLAQIADREPLRAISGKDLPLDGLSGTAKAKISTAFPIKRALSLDDVIYDIEVVLLKFKSKKAIEGHIIDNANVTIKAQPESLHIFGTARIDGLNAEIDLQDAEGIKDDSLNVATILNKQERDRLGLDLRSWLKGPVGVQIEKNEQSDNDEYTIDLTKATLRIQELGWAKKSGKPASAKFILSTKGNVKEARNLVIKAPGLKIRGSLILDGDTLRSMNFDEVTVTNQGTLKLAIERKKNVRHIKIRGGQIYVENIIDSLFSGEKDDESWHYDLILDSLIGKSKEAVRNVRIIAEQKNGALTSFDLKGKFSSGSQVIGDISTIAGIGRAIAITTPDAGAAVRFLGLYKRISGGFLEAYIKLPSVSKALSGKILITDFRVIDEPALIRLLAGDRTRSKISGGGSPNRGEKHETPRNVRFDKLTFEFNRPPSKIMKIRASVRGPSLGVRMVGKINYAKDKIDINGTYIPAYQINNFFSKLPILGRILGNRDDEGLFAVTFKISGTLEDPILTINPISLIAPGVLRQMFEFK